jgi:hypothetical protein
MPITPPRLGGRTVPRGFIPYACTKEEEIEALKLVFWLDGSNPYKDDAYNINQFRPMSRYEEADYHTYLITLHSGTEVVNKYVAIQELMKHMFSTQHAWVPSDNIGSRYMYSTSLYEYLHQSETPLARTRRTGIEKSPRTTLQYIDSTERKDEVQEEPKQNVWISKTVKRAKDRDQRMTAREKLKQRLTKNPTTLTSPPTNEKEISIFESEDEEEEDTVMDERKDDNEIIEDEVLSRLRRQEQEYLQEQEETKSEVLLESTTGSTTGSTMEGMMERKIKIRTDQMEARQTSMEVNWEQQQTSMTRQVDRVTQIERITND